MSLLPGDLAIRLKNMTPFVTIRIHAAMIFVLATSCLAQDGALTVANMLGKTHQSGSLGYWSPQRCGHENDRYPTLPRMSRATNGATALASLQELFSKDDARMHVTEDSMGMIRMLESDVPNDILNVRINHISFNGRVQGADLFRGPNSAMRSIFSAPEVQAFAETHHIKRFFSSRLPNNASSGARAYGELNDVTVSQALDYLLRIFPGYWIYGNCTGEGGNREIYFWFVETGSLK
jgi:hypothetical protein